MANRLATGARQFPGSALKVSVNVSLGSSMTER